jgi:hypothetical protein
LNVIGIIKAFGNAHIRYEKVLVGIPPTIVKSFEFDSK